MPTIARHSLRTVHLAVHDREPFDCNGTLTGTTSNAGVGCLPREYRDGFLAASRADDFFAVYSYQTPIAWHVDGVWVVPPKKYSPTTGRHMSSLRLYKAVSTTPLPGSGRFANLIP